MVLARSGFRSGIVSDVAGKVLRSTRLRAVGDGIGSHSPLGHHRRDTESAPASRRNPNERRKRKRRHLAGVFSACSADLSA